VLPRFTEGEFYNNLVTVLADELRAVPAARYGATPEQMRRSPGSMLSQWPNILTCPFQRVARVEENAKAAETALDTERGGTPCCGVRS